MAKIEDNGPEAKAKVLEKTVNTLLEESAAVSVLMAMCAWKLHAKLTKTKFLPYININMLFKPDPNLILSNHIFPFFLFFCPVIMPGCYLAQVAAKGTGQNLMTALEKAKAASKKEKLLCKHREANQLTEQINLDLTYAVCLNLATCYHKNEMFQEVCSPLSSI